MLHRVLFLPSFIMGEKTEKRNVYKNGAHFHNQWFLPPSSHVNALAFTLSRVYLEKQVGGEEVTENLFLEERLALREANEKKVLE
jgi:hypothetical protein